MSTTCDLALGAHLWATHERRAPLPVSAHHCPASDAGLKRARRSKHAADELSRQSKAIKRIKAILSRLNATQLAFLVLVRGGDARSLEGATDEALANNCMAFSFFWSQPVPGAADTFKKHVHLYFAYHTCAHRRMRISTRASSG